MKKIIAIIMTIFLCSFAAFADDQGDEYDDGYVYEINGAGDQIMKMEIGCFLPINFAKQLKPGASLGITYLRFIDSSIALGGGIQLTTNLSIGNKTFITLPIYFTMMYQPTIDKLEFPLEVSVGGSLHTMASISYFPALSLKGSAGAYYRFSETWSAGLTAAYTWSPEWVKEKSKNFNGMFSTVSLNVRYHF